MYQKNTIRETSLHLNPIILPEEFFVILLLKSGSGNEFIEIIHIMDRTNSQDKFYTDR